MIIPDGVKFEDYIEIIGDLESPEIHPAGHWTDDVLSCLEPEENSNSYLLPWEKSQENFHIRPNEITIWGGYNGARKSMMVGWIMLHVAKQGGRVAIASLEMTPKQTLWRMCQQAAGLTNGLPSERFIKDFMKWADDRFVVYDVLDSIKTERVLGFVNYCATKLNVDNIVIDSLAKCGVGFENRTGEENFINRLAYSAKHFNTHIHLVAHVRKPIGGEDQLPSKYDIRGASSLVDMVDNVILCWSNKRREVYKDFESLDEKQLEYFEKSYDQKLIVAKQRHGSWEGSINLYSHHSLQFTSRENKAMPFNLEEENDKRQNEGNINTDVSHQAKPGAQVDVVNRLYGD